MKKRAKGLYYFRTIAVWCLVFVHFALPASAQLTIVDYGLCRTEDTPKRAMVGDSPDGVSASEDISIIEKTNMISATKGTCFGVMFTAPQTDSENVGLEARIYHPPIRLDNGRIKESTELPLFIFTDKPSFVGWQFSSPNELVSGDWVIEFTNDYKVLGRQRFMVQATPMAADAMAEMTAKESAPEPVAPMSAPEPMPEPLMANPMDDVAPEPVMTKSPAPTPSMDKPDHPVESAASEPLAGYRYTGEWETITRYMVQVAAHSKHDNMIAFEQKLRGMGLSPFSFVGPCNCPYKDLYLTFVYMGRTKQDAREYVRNVKENYGIAAFVKPIKAVVPAGWPQ